MTRNMKFPMKQVKSSDSETLGICLAEKMPFFFSLTENANEGRVEHTECVRSRQNKNGP